MRKIALVSSSVSRAAGGLLSALQPLSLELNFIDGFQPVVFGGRDQFTDDDLVGWGDLSVCISDTYFSGSVGYQPTLVSKIKSTNPSLVHIHGLWMYPSIRFSFDNSLPKIISPHGMLDPWALKNSGFKKRLAWSIYEKRNLVSAKCIHALCECEATSIRKLGLKNDIAIIPNGVHIPECSSGSIARRWGSQLPTDAKVMLYLGRFHPKKGLDTLIRGFGEYLKSSDTGSNPWYLVLAGWDQQGYEGYLKTLAETLAIQDRVLFVGPQFGEDKVATFRSSDAFILPSLSEGLPMAVLEAWSFGLPVLMTEACNLGIGFEANAAIKIECNVDAIRAGIDKFIKIGNEGHNLIAENAKTLIERGYLWPSIANDFSRLYSYVLDGGPRPSFLYSN